MVRLKTPLGSRCCRALPAALRRAVAGSIAVKAICIRKAGITDGKVHAVLNRQKSKIATSLIALGLRSRLHTQRCAQPRPALVAATAYIRSQPIHHIRSRRGRSGRMCHARSRQKCTLAIGASQKSRRPGASAALGLRLQKGDRSSSRPASLTLPRAYHPRSLTFSTYCTRSRRFR